MAAAKKTLLLALGLNFTLSWTVLPLLLPPGGPYPLAELLEALLWQALGLLFWPLALLGGCLSGAAALASGAAPGVDPAALLPLLLYPAFWMLLLAVLRARPPRGWQVVLLHLLLALSFAAVWIQVRQGVEWMAG